MDLIKYIDKFLYSVVPLSYLKLQFIFLSLPVVSESLVLLGL